MTVLASPASALPAAGMGVSEGDLFKKVLGAAWLQLHPDIQRRFDKVPVPGHPLFYRGQLSELSSSRVGKLLGTLCTSPPHLLLER